MSESPESSPVERLLARMTSDSVDAAGLDEKTLMMVRIAALIAVDAPPASYLLNLGAASQVGFEDDDIRAILMAVAPIVGTSRTVSAVSKMAKAFGFALGFAAED